MITDLEPANRRTHLLARRSLDIILAGQAPSGAYIACPAYATYGYAWFRDGTFTARAVERWGKRESSARFYTWACSLIVARAAAIERCARAGAAGRRPDAADLLHTRYTVDGEPSSEAWPNFQLDGFGTLLWGIERHVHGLTQPLASMPRAWETAVRLLVRYLITLWQQPNYDCWEEFPICIGVSTLATVYAGLRSAASLLSDADGETALAAAESIRAFVLERGTVDGHLTKHIDGDDAVDASLLWASTPYGEHAMLSPLDPIMLATTERIAGDLMEAGGGLHRYRADTFYGGGEWTLLTALFGQYCIQAGDRTGALRCLGVVEAHADLQFLLPEQWSTAVLAPACVPQWIEQWGPVATPLLWAHAEYLQLAADLGLA